MESNLGRILEATRKESDIMPAYVYEGICTKSMYYEFTAGKRLPEKYVYDALLQRMGKSADQFEAILTESEYEWVLSREKIEELIIGGKLDEAEELRKEVPVENFIQEQYLMQIDGILLYYSGKYAESAKKFRAAYELTGNGKLFTLQEYLILLMYYEAKRKSGEVLMDLLQDLYDYCKEHISDTREQVKVLPKTILCMIEQWAEQEEWEKVYQYATKGMSLLSHEGEILGMRELLCCYKAACEHLQMPEMEGVTWIIDALGELYEEYGYPMPDRMGCLLKKSIRTEYYLASEYFRNYRNLMEMTQEDMDDIVSDRHLRRIEAGKIRPTDITFKKFSDLTENQKNRITGYMNAVDFKVLEHNARCAAAFSRSDYEAAEREWNLLNQYQDTDSKRYRQIMERRYLFLETRKGKITNEECIEKYKELLELTQPGYKWENLSKLELSRCEVELLNAMGSAYRRSGNPQKAEYIWRSILDHFAESKIMSRHSAANLVAVLENFSGMLESQNRFEESIYYCKMGIKIALECSWGNSLQDFLTQLAYSQERQKREQGSSISYEKIRKNYTIGGLIAKMMGEQWLFQFTMDYLEKNFNVSLPYPLSEKNHK